MNFQSDPNQWTRYFGKVIRGRDRDELFQDAMLTAVETAKKVDSSMSQPEIRAFMMRAVLWKIGQKRIAYRTIYTVTTAITNRSAKDARWLIDTDLRTRYAYQNRKRIVVAPSGEVTPMVDWAESPTPGAVELSIRSEDHERGVNMIAKSEILKDRYGGRSVEDTARSRGVSRVEQRMNEIAELRKVGAL